MAPPSATPRHRGEPAARVRRQVEGDCDDHRRRQQRRQDLADGSRADAAQEHIKIFTILVGKGGLVPFPAGTDFFGNPAYQQVEVDINPDLLMDISKATGGTYYRATDKETLAKGLDDILDKLDKSKLAESGGYQQMDELFGLFLLPALALLAMELALSATRLRSFP